MLTKYSFGLCVGNGREMSQLQRGNAKSIGNTGKAAKKPIDIILEIAYISVRVNIQDVIELLI